MLKGTTRARVIQIWFVGVVVVVAGAVVFGAGVTASTAAVLLVLCVVPPAIVLFLWPGVQSPTVAEVLHEVDRRV
jgi:hypothetical protein